jgi:hypothetical protein
MDASIDEIEQKKIVYRNMNQTIIWVHRGVIKKTDINQKRRVSNDLHRELGNTILILVDLP